MTERPDRKRKGSPEWIRLGDLLARRRGELDARYAGHGGRLPFAQDSGVNLKLIQDLENNGRENFTQVKLRDEVAPAYGVTFPSLMSVLEDDGDLEALPGTPPHKSPRRRKAAVSLLPGPAASEETEIPGVLNMLAVPGIGRYLAELDAEREQPGWEPANRDEARIWLNPQLRDPARRALVAYRRMVLDEAARSRGEGTG